MMMIMGNVSAYVKSFPKTSRDHSYLTALGIQKKHWSQRKISQFNDATRDAPRGQPLLMNLGEIRRKKQEAVNEFLSAKDNILFY